MLKTLIIFLMIFAGMIAGPFIAGEQGLALFRIAGYQVKMSFITFLIFNILLFLFLIFCYSFFDKLFGYNNIFSYLFNLLFHYNTMQKSQLMVLEGNYKKAKKLLSKNAKNAENQALAYLQATQVAIDNYDLKSANVLLEKAALTCTDKERLAFQVVQTRLLLKNNKLNEAKIRVETLLDTYPRQPEVLRLADNIYYTLGNYQKVIDIVPAMYRANAYPKDQVKQYEQIAYIGLIKQLAQQPEISALKNWWYKQSKSIRKNIIYQKEMVQQFNLLGQDSEAEKIRTQIKKQKMSC